jgi:hypothetical protein
MGFEPMVEVLQTSALPLGYRARNTSQTTPARSGQAASVYHSVTTTNKRGGQFGGLRRWNALRGDSVALPGSAGCRRPLPGVVHVNEANTLYCGQRKASRRTRGALRPRMARKE